MEFIIYCPGFNERIGGVYALHLLCHLLNSSGQKAHMFPWFYHDEISAIHIQSPLDKALASRRLLENYPVYATNPRWITPLFQRSADVIDGSNEFVVIYPEVVFGNPLRARHIARWLLNTPGVHNKKIYFTHGEVQFLYGEFFVPLKQRGLELAEFYLYVLEVPWALFDHAGQGEEIGARKGIAYALRKGRGKSIQHRLSGSILIDNMSMTEIAKIFKEVKTFISYDDATLYSMLAVLSGCESIVVPEPGVTREEWRGNREDTFGLAYGFEDLKWANETKHLVWRRLRDLEASSQHNVEMFIEYWIKKVRS